MASTLSTFAARATGSARGTAVRALLQQHPLRSVPSSIARTFSSALDEPPSLTRPAIVSEHHAARASSRLWRQQAYRVFIWAATAVSGLIMVADVDYVPATAGSHSLSAVQAWLRHAKDALITGDLDKPPA